MELRIMAIKMRNKNWLQRLAATVGEGGEYELKLLSVFSDGIKDEQLHLNLDVIPIKVKTGLHLFGPHGFTLYRSPKNKIPDFIDAHLTVLEDDSGIRTTAGLMYQASKTEEYQGMVDMITTLVSNAAAPAISIAKELFGLAMMVMKGNNDDIFMQADASFNKEYGEYNDFKIDSDELSVWFEFKGGEVMDNGHDS